MKPRWLTPLLWLALLGPALALSVMTARSVAAAPHPAVAHTMAPARTMTSAPMTATPPGPQEDIREIRGPVALPKPTPLGWWVAGGAAALAALGTLLLLRRRAPRPLAPHERALATLAAQRRNPDPSPQAFSVVLSEAIRSYVEEAFPVRAAHRTTDELLADLMADASPVAAQRGELGLFLHHCDLAKFARWSLAPGDREAMLDSAEAFVRATAAPVPTPPPQPRKSAPAGAGHFA